MDNRGEKMKMAIGMDLHSKMSTTHALYARGTEVPSRHQKFLNDFNKTFGEFPSTPNWFKRMADFVSKHECYVLIENSTYTNNVYWILTNLGLHVTVAQAQDLYRITKSMKKTDKYDCIELAGYMRRRLNGEIEFAECYIPSPEWMTRREMCRGLSHEKDYLADTKRRIRAFLLLRGINLRAEYADITSNRALMELSEIKDPYLMMQVRFASDCKKRIDFFEKTMLSMFEDLKMYQLIRSIPGFGALSAAYFTSLIIDIHRFPNSKKFVASFGVVPRIRSSSDSNPRCSTTHRGDELARHLLMYCVMGHLNHQEDSVVTRMYRRLVENGKPKREAQVAAGRKLLTVMYSVLKNQRQYVSDPYDLIHSYEDEDSEREDFGLTDVAEVTSTD